MEYKDQLNHSSNQPPLCMGLDNTGSYPFSHSSILWETYGVRRDICAFCPNRWKKAYGEKSSRLEFLRSPVSQVVLPNVWCLPVLWSLLTSCTVENDLKNGQEELQPHLYQPINFWTFLNIFISPAFDIHCSPFLLSVTMIELSCRKLE